MFDHVVCGPLGEHPEQIPYPGGKRAYPVHPPLRCRLGMVFPWVPTLVEFDVGDDVEFPLLLYIGFEGVPPQLTRVRAIKINKQIFTEILQL